MAETRTLISLNSPTLRLRLTFDMTTSRAVLLALAAVTFANQAAFALPPREERQASGHQSNPDDDNSGEANELEYLHKSIKVLADDVAAIQRGLKYWRRSGTFGMGMGQTQEGQLQIQISDDEPWPQNQASGYPVQTYPSSQSASQTQPGSYPYGQQAPSQSPTPQKPHHHHHHVRPQATPQGGAPQAMQQNPLGNQQGVYASPVGAASPQYGYPPQQQAQMSPMGMHAGFSGFDTSVMAF